ncbi:MAG: DUF4406 domain-containing protein [Bacilli bacterium]|nr:DUF4406 domain-containing protein [Bacilli bacterium]
MRLMISQPMRGKSNEQIRNERETLVKQLESEGHEVVDTVISNFIDGEGNDYAIKCLARSIEYISQVDGLVFMNGWQNARGCKIEYQVAKEYEKFIKEVN